MFKRSFFILACLTLLTPLGLSAQVWDPDTRLTNQSASSNTNYNNAWCIAVSGDTLHVVWYDDRDGNLEIYYKRSADGGTSWGPDIRLTNNNNFSYFPSVVVSGSNIHIVWRDDRDGNPEIYYKRSTDGGTSWDSDTRLTNNSSYSWYPSVAVSGSTVHVVWVDDRDGNFEIYYKRSADGGTSWGTDTRLTNNSSESGSPSVAVSGSNVHVVWMDERDGNYEIYNKRSADGGASWGSDTRLTDNSNVSECPSVAVSGSNINVVWDDDRDGNYEIYYKRSANGGTSWGSDTRLTINSSESRSPSVAVAGSNVYLVWHDDRDCNFEVYYKRSADGGTSWSPDTRLTNADLNSGYPSVAVSGSNIHVVWSDERDENWEIYYKRGGEAQPDNQIKNFADAAYIGDGIYNLNGNNQTKVQTVIPGDDAIYHVKIENDGDVSDTVTVTGTGSVEGWTVTYYDALTGGTDITSDVTGSGWSIQDIDPGDYTEIRLEVSPDEGLPGDSSYDVLVTSTSEKNNEKKDAVKASTTTEFEAAYQPDNQIKNSSETTYIGNDIYNGDGEDQTKAQTVDVGDTAVYHVKIENDGNAPDTFIIAGPGSGMGWDVRYFDALEGGTDITSQVTGSGWSSGELAAGDSKQIRVEVTQSSDPDTITYGVLVTSTSKGDNTKLDAVKAETTVQGDYQPDNQIKNPVDASYTGDDIYNTDGMNQTSSQTVDVGNTAVYHVKVENDGNIVDTVIVAGTAGNAGWTVRYFDALSAGTEITSDVTGSGWSSGELASGNAREMRVEVTPPSSASNGTSYDVLVTSTSVADDAFEDAIKATTTVKIGGVEEKTAPLAYFLYVSPLSSGKGFAITYTLPQASKVTLSVYDAAGRAVKVLEFGMVEAGSHEVELGDVSLSKGVYFVKFSSGSFTETAKLIILK